MAVEYRINAASQRRPVAHRNTQRAPAVLSTRVIDARWILDSISATGTGPERPEPRMTHIPDYGGTVSAIRAHFTAIIFISDIRYQNYSTSKRYLI